MVLGEKNILIETEINAKNQIYSGEEAWNVIADAEKIYIASGRDVTEFCPATADKDELLKKITGRTGNLRAPTLKSGREFYIGYNDDMYKGLA
jgi:hypothetical protein